MQMKFTMAGIVMALATAAHAKDDPAQCKRMVDAFVQGEAMVSPTSSMADNSRRKTDTIQKMRAEGVSECDIQRWAVGTAAQVEEKRIQQR